MQKDLKIMDKELANNQLIRIHDQNTKQDQSIFRALSAAVYYSHLYAAQVKLDLRLGLVCNLNERKNNPYPPLGEGNILKKFINEGELVMNFWERQELECFHHDNLVLASAVFGMHVCLYTIDKEEYLNETYIVGCKNPNEQKINLAKVGKRFYCVLDTTLHTDIKFIKEYLIEEIINGIFMGQDEEEEKKQENIVSSHKLRQHKKSLSECRELTQQEIFPEQKIQKSMDNDDMSRSSPVSHGPPSHPFEDVIPQAEKIEEPSVSAQNYEQGGLPQNYNNYYGYQYSHYMMGHDQMGFMQEPYAQNYNYMQPSGPIPNQRYQGRLKFFDQSGNYGFIVIDNLNIDLFVHFDDLSKAGLSKEKLLGIKNNYEMRFQFTYYEYEGKLHKKSKKAVDLQLIE